MREINYNFYKYYISKYILIGKNINLYIPILFIYIFFTFHGLAYAALPSSTNFQLKGYSFGAGGANNSTSTNYGLYGVAGEIEFGKSSSTNFQAGTGLTYLINAFTPPAPTLNNGSGTYYNKLLVTINNANNPADTQFAIAVSPDNFTITTKYIQADGTLGATPLWQTYTSWGGSSGSTIIGLTPGTTYSVKVTAKQGKFAQSPFGPVVQLATVNPTFSMSLSSNTLTFPPLVPGTIQTSTTSVTVNVTTNSNSGASIYGYDNNTGLSSPSTNYTISTVNNNLGSVSEGYGLQGTSVGQTSGGPMEIISPYNGSGNNVGVLDTTKRSIFDSTGTAVTGGTGTFQLQAKAGTTAKAATDYTDTLTIIASAVF